MDLRAPASCHLRLLGEFGLSTAAGEAVAIPSRRARGILAYLALTAEKAAARPRLHGLFWSDRGETQARASLRQCLLELKAALGGAGLQVIDVTLERVALGPAFSSDVDELMDALADDDVDRAARLIKAAGANRLLESFDFDGPVGEWVDHERARTDRTLASATLAMLERLEAGADWRGVRAVAEAWLARDPFDEAVVAAAMRADAALGTASAARRRFQILEAAPSRDVALGAPPVVVVARFGTNDTSGSEDRLAATLRDEVLSGLSRFHDLRVVTDPRPLDQVAADISADRAGAYALGANVRDGPEGRRLIVQLLRSGERHLIWAHRLALSQLGIIGASDDVIAPVVAAVLPSIQADQMRRPGEGAPDRSYTRFLLARGPDAKARNFQEAKAAAAALETMIAADPGFAPPYLPLVFLYNTDFQYTRAGASGQDERDRAFDLAKQALALDRANVHAYSALGWCYLRRRNWRAARDHFDQVLALNPYHVRRLMEVGYGHLFLGELDSAKAMLDRCILLNPAAQDGYFSDLGLLSLVRGEHELAASYFELTADPEIWNSVYSLINAELGALPVGDKRDKARARVAAIWPEQTAMTTDAIVGWIAGHHPFQREDILEPFLAAAGRAFTGP